MNITKELEVLKERVSKLEKRRMGRIGEMNSWIRQKIEPDGFITVRKLKKEAKLMDYSWQMLQRTRRDMQDIVVKWTEDFGYVWKLKNFHMLTVNKKVRTQRGSQDFEIN